jgi:hypothetical protein
VGADADADVNTDSDRHGVGDPHAASPDSDCATYAKSDGDSNRHTQRGPDADRYRNSNACSGAAVSPPCPARAL